MDFSLITGAVAAIGTAKEIGKTALDIRDGVKLAEVVSRMNEQLLNAQESLFAHNAQILELQQKYFEASQQLRELREAASERSRYTLFEICPGHFAYRANTLPIESGTGTPVTPEPEHYICQHCYDGATRRKIVLQRIEGNGFRTFWRCHACGFQT